MPKIKVTPQAVAALRSASINPREPFAPGGWFDIDDETLAALDASRFPSETRSDTIVRLAAFFVTGGRKQ